MRGVVRYVPLLFLIIIIAMISGSLPVKSDDLFNCTIRASCLSNETVFIGLKNDTGGYNNAHAQLGGYKGTAYPYNVCCHTQQWRNLVNDNSTYVLRLYNSTNAHVQTGNQTGYIYPQRLDVDVGSINCSYPSGSCPQGYACLVSIASSEGDNTTNAHVAECSYYSTKVCCKLQSAPPNMPELVWPENNTNITIRTPNLNWTSTVDPDGDSVTYDLNLSASPGCTIEHYETGISDSNFTTNELCVDSVYYWKVRACDIDGCSSWTEPWQFIVESQLSINFTVDTVDFGIMNINENDNTTDDSPTPLTLENTGIVNVDVDIKANDTMFTTVSLNNTNFQYKVSVNESGSFDSGSSQVSFTNFTSAYTTCFVNLSYINASDAGNVEINVTIPPDEPPGSLSSVIIARATAS